MKKHLLGQHFTPQPLVRLVCGLGITSPDARVLDPACGDGAFLRGAAERLQQLGRKQPEDDQVVGIEIDPAHAASAREATSATVHTGDFFEHQPHPEFDSIVGNFPFIRQERLSERRQHLPDLIARHWATEFPEAGRLSSRADLYLYFFFYAAKFLKPGGRMAVISGNSWLHAPYGRPLRNLLQVALRLELIVESRAEVFFPDTSVNPVVTVLSNDPPARAVSFAQLTQPLPPEPDFSPQNPLPTTAHVREVSAEKLHDNDDWHCLLRAPAVFFELSDCTRGLLAPLGQLADIRRGVTTGLNRFFYIDEKEAARREIEPEFLLPVITSLKDIDSLVLRPQHARRFLIAADAPRETLAGSKLLAYIEEFERSGDMPENSPTLANRLDWYRLRGPSPGDLVLLRFRRERHFAPINPHALAVGDTVFTARFRDRILTPVLCAAANSTLFHFFAEFIGRDNMGGGFITTYGPELQKLPLPTPLQLAPHHSQLLQAFEALAKRPLLTMQQELHLADRRRLDEIIWRSLALPDSLLDDLYTAFEAQLIRRKQHGQMSRGKQPPACQ